MSNEKHETVADIMAEIVGRDAACRKPVTDCHGLNAAAMREALVMVKRLFDGRLMWQPDIRKAHEAVNAALAAPPRNCDVGTAEEQAERFYAFCGYNRFQSGIKGMCSSLCPCIRCRDMCGCITTWAQMPYDEVDK